MEFTRIWRPVDTDPIRCELQVVLRTSEYNLLRELLRKASGQTGLAWNGPTPTEKAFLKKILSLIGEPPNESR